MELALIIWLINALNGFIILFAFGIAVSCISLAVSLAAVAEGIKWARKGVKIAATFVVIFSLLAAITPSEKTGWMMAGGYVAQKAVQSDTAKKLGFLVEKKLEGLIEEIDEEAKKKIKQNSLKESK